ncbi:MAG: fructose-specific PTS transporter subunit EIIC [Oscillospiraceae bacterium]
MRITDLLRPESLFLGAPPTEKAALIHRLVELQTAGGNLSDPALFEADVLKREAQSATAIGAGIAVPHAKSEGVLRPGLSAVTMPAGTPFGAPDGSDSTLFFCIAAPLGDGDIHLELLARLMGLLMNPQFPEKLLAAQSKDEFFALIDTQEQESYPDEPPCSPTPEATKSPEHFRVLAVTACPTGISHTYLAAEALARAGEKLGISLKVETQGSIGTKNPLTEADIAACDGIIVAADIDVGLERFRGKPVFNVSVSEGIRRPEALLQSVLEQAAAHPRPATPPPEPAFRRENTLQRLYRHLMNGVSHMLPFVIGGGLLIAISYLLDASSVTTETMANFGVITPGAAFFSGVGKLAFGFMLPVLSAYIAESIADRPGLAVGFVGGALAATGTTFASFSDPSFVAVPAGFLGALLAGFVAGYLMLLLRKLCSKLPEAVEGLKPVLLYPLLGIFGIGLFICMVNPLLSGFNALVFGGLTAMGGTSKVILGMVVAAMMGVDLGGPCNKIAYLFGTASLISAAGVAISSDIMAAVTLGGMVPPLCIALTCTFFGNRFSPGQRRLGYTNYIMGLCFITEGALPFAAADPKRVIPACIAGSAVAGGLSMFFGCSLPAPHGGIFLVPIMTNPKGFLLALCAGSLVGMVILALTKHKIGGTEHGI